jgi:hypothetical protein
MKGRVRNANGCPSLIVMRIEKIHFKLFSKSNLNPSALLGS